MKHLTPVIHDRGTCRLYVEDENKRPYVILENDKNYAQHCGIRFELYTHTKDGEPCCPIRKDIQWVLTEGVKNTVFTKGLSNVH